MKNRSSDKKKENKEKQEIAENLNPGCRASLQGRLGQVSRLLMERQQAALAKHKLDLRSYAALGGLEHAPCATQLDLAKQCRVDKSTLVAILDALEGAGLVERTPDARDRRARIVQATPTGKAVLAAAHVAVRDIESQFLAGLSEPQREVFLTALTKLAAQT